MPILDRKDPKSDLKHYYNLFLEAGLIAAMVILLILFKVHYNPKNNEHFQQQEQETVKMKDVVQTEQQKTPPPPPAPEAPQAVPNDQVISDQPLNLNSEINLNSPLKIPPPPPSKNKKNDNANKIFIAVQKMPKLLGGLGNLQRKIHYPDLARKAGIEGTVYVQFVVNEQGRVTDAHVIRGIGGGCDQEALRVVKKARFQPGMQRGRPVNVRFSLPIVFRLRNE